MVSLFEGKYMNEPEVVTPPSSSPVKTNLSNDELAEYVAVAERIGLKSPSLLSEKLRHCLQDENIHMYNVDQVGKFLTKKLGEWHWRGIRQCDVDELKDGWSMESDGKRIQFSDRLYADKIPLPVLLTVEKIQAAVPEAHFYVSTAGKPNEDPFLLVTARNVGAFIVERWDEPDFRER